MHESRHCATNHGRRMTFPVPNYLPKSRQALLEGEIGFEIACRQRLIAIHLEDVHVGDLGSNATPSLRISSLARTEFRKYCRQNIVRWCRFLVLMLES
jgi:hypothetical protein